MARSFFFLSILLECSSLCTFHFSACVARVAGISPETACQLDRTDTYVSCSLKTNFAAGSRKPTTEVVHEGFIIPGQLNLRLSALVDLT